MIMSRLTTKSPTHVTIGDMQHPINTDFLAALRAYSYLQDVRLKAPENATERVGWFLFALYETYGIQDGEADQPEGYQLQLFLELFSELVDTPELMEEAVLKALWFLRCGEYAQRDNPANAALIDFEIDSRSIFDALLKKGVNLDDIDYMHWWIFCSHLAEVPESRLTRIAYLRHQLQRGKLTKDEREECSRIGWDIINMTTEEEKTAREEDDSFIDDIFAAAKED